MQGRIALITAVILTLTTSYAEAAPKNIAKNSKSKAAKVQKINLKVQDDKIKPEPLPTEISFSSFSTNQPQETLIDKMPVKPEFKYSMNDDDYNYRNNQYEREIKLKVNLDF